MEKFAFPYGKNKLPADTLPYAG